MDTRDRDRNRDNERRLHFLDDLSGYKVASDDPDVRGWNVVDGSNNRVGKVDNLLVDSKAEKVRYLDVELDESMIKKGHDAYAHGKSTGVHEFETRDGDVHMIVPIGLARVDTDNKTVVSDEINTQTIQNGHLHRKGEHITPDHERNVLTTLSDAEKRGSTRTGYGPSSGTSDKSARMESTETKRHGIPEDTISSRTGSSNEMTNSGTRNLSGTTSDSGIGRRDSERNPESMTGSERTSRTGDNIRSSSDTDHQESDVRNREMRRPESNSDTRLSQDAKRRERISERPGSPEASGRRNEKYSPEATDRYSDDSWSFETHRNERLSRSEEARGPVQSNFYTHRYFDEDRFYGRR